MSITFEELADAGIPVEPVTPARSSRLGLFLFALLLLLVVGGGLVIYLNRQQTESSLPDAATRLLVVEGEVPEGVLPHVMDDSTEFKESFVHLKQGFEAPEYREPEVVAEVYAMETIPPVSVGAVIPREELEIPVTFNHARAGSMPSDAIIEVDGMRDWEGIVLVPDNVRLARAYTSDVRLNRVEAHPIDNGRLRVWSRIENLTDREIAVETACEFRFADRFAGPSSFQPERIPARGAIDVVFVSPREGVNSYTLMVKQ